MTRTGLLASRKAEIGVGVVLFVAGSLLIRDAYDGRGRQVPWFWRPFAWW